MSKNQASGEVCRRTSIGGQALIEGVMMLGPDKEAISVRDKNGEVITTVKDIKPIKDKYPILGWPIIRGPVNLFLSLKRGIAAINYSAAFYPEEEDPNYKPSKLDLWLEKKLESKKAQDAFMGFATVLGFVLAVALFFLLPNLLAGFLKNIIESRLLLNLIEGAIRIALFLGYIIGISKMKDIARVFAYHGAEHKTIFCYEADKELTVENVRPMSRLHPRCGTSFLFVVLIISIILFAFVSWKTMWLRFIIRILLIPVVVGFSYEINRFVGRHDNLLTRILTAPGLWLQNFTTNEPDDGMIETAIASLKAVIPEREGADQW